MTDAWIFTHVDHTLLSATASQADIEKLCAEAIEHQTASVCIPACYVSFARGLHAKLNICTVIGFPLGYNTTISKIAEAEQALKDTADEIDMVINLTDVKNGRFNAVEDEISRIKQTVSNGILKVIIETCYLEHDEKVSLCKAVTNAGADYIKTSTGFGTAGATMADVKLFKQHIGSGVKIKAAGGIRTREDMIDFINSGAQRLGTSSAVKILCARSSDKETGGY